MKKTKIFSEKNKIDPTLFADYSALATPQQ
jgi:hypothetical protein